MKWKIIILAGFALFHNAANGQKKAATSGLWTVLAAYNIDTYVNNLAWDGRNIFAHGDGQFGDPEYLYRFNPLNHSFTFYCHIPSYYQVPVNAWQPSAFGLTYKFPDFVTIQADKEMNLPTVTAEFDTLGHLGNVNNCPYPSIEKICWDTDHYWGCGLNSNTIKKFVGQNTLSVINTSTPVGNLCTQGSFLWFAGTNDTIYKIDQSGLIFDREASSFGTPTAIVFDSTYLWYLGYNSITQEIKLIKVDLNGIGTPAFKIDSLMHDYGFIIFGDSSAWNCTIRNSGTAPLIIDQFTFPSATPFSADVSLPITISPGDSVKVKFTFLPLNTGRFDMNVIVHANDLCYPEKTINLKGIAGYAGAHIEIIVPGFDFGERRLKSTTLWKARIVNNGAQPLSISSITSGNPVFTIGKYSTFPIDIQFLDTTDVWIWFQPRKAKLYTDALSINSNSITQNPFTINITGTGKDSIYSPLSQLWDYAYIPLYGLEEPVAILPIGDISGDSIPDIVVSIGTGKLVCLNGNASGTADVLWSDSFGQFSHCRDQHGIATIPDMDGDSINDVVFADYNGDTVYALSGRTGIIIWKYGTQGIPEQVDATYDYNGDGIPDVLVAYSYSTVNCLGYNTAVRCLNSKTGSVIWSMATNYCAYAVKGVPDFTGDGKPDAVVAIREYYDVGPNPKIYGLDGSNGHISYSSDNSIVQYFIVIDDITGDGIPDLASIDFSGTVLTDLKTGIEQCGNFSYSGYHDLNLIDMGTSPGSPAKRILVSSSYIGIISPPDCSWEWWRNGFLATNAGDLNGDSINDVFFNNHPFKGTTDTIGYLNGKNGHLLKTQILNKEVNIARPFTDITGSGYSTVVVGGVGYIYCLSGAYISTTGIPETDTGKEQKSALQLFPNPASEIVNIRIELPEEGLTRLNVYDSRGMLIETIMNNELSRGRHDLRWDISGKNLSGLYFVQLLTGRYQETGKLMVVPSE